MDSNGTRFSFDTAAAITLIGSAALAVVLFIPSLSASLIPTKVSLVSLGLLVSLVFFVLARLTKGNLVVPPIGLLGALVFVPLAYALSTLFSGVSPAAAFFGTNFEPDTFGFILILFVTAALAALAFRHAKHYRMFFLALMGAIALACVVQVLIIIFARLMPGSVTASTNIIGSMMDLGMFAGLFILLSLLAFRFLALSKRMRVLLSVLLVVALFVLGGVNAGALWILTALAGLALFIESIMKKSVQGGEEDLEGVSTMPAEEDALPKGKRSLIAPLGVLIVSFFFIVGGATLGNSFSLALGTNVLDARPSWQSTFTVGSHTFAASPLFGSGPGSFGEQWLKFRDRSVNETVFWSVDFTSGIGFIPTSFVTTGIFGALAWIVFLGLFLFMGMRALLFRMPSDSFMRFVSLASFVGSFFVLALSVFTVPGPMVLVTGLLLLGIFISSLRYGKTRQEWGVVFAKSPRVGFAIVFGFTLLLLASVVGAYGVVQRYIAELSYAESVAALSALALDRAEEAATRSNTFSESDRAYRILTSAGIARMSQIAADPALSPTVAQEQFQNALTKSLEAAQRATDANEGNYQNWSLLGSVYQAVVPLAIEGAYENALTAYQRAMALNPTSPVLPLAIAQLEITRGNAALAEESLLAAIALKRDYTQAIFLLSQLQVAEGRAREALEAAEAAAYFAPQDSIVLFQLGILRSGNGDTAGAIAALSKAAELNPEYANAHFFLGVMYALSSDFPRAIAELETVAAFSPENAAAVAQDLEELRNGKNPFPPSRLGALGIPQVPVSDGAPAAP